jgi:hypothetical protein
MKQRLNPETWAAGVASVVREFVDRRLGDVLPRVADMAGRVADLDGRLRALPDVDARMAELTHAYTVGLEQRLAALPTPPGADDIRAAVDAGVAGYVDRLTAVEARPVVDPDDLRALGAEIVAVRTTVEALPPPLSEDAVRPWVAAVVEHRTEPLNGRMAALEARPAPPVPDLWGVDAATVERHLRTTLGLSHG